MLLNKITNASILLVLYNDKCYNTDMKNQYKEKNGIIYRCNYYVVWCVKYKRKLLVDTVAERCKELIKSECDEMDVVLLKLSIYPNHIRILVGGQPQQNIHKIVKALKRKTAGVMRKEFKELSTKLPTLWDNRYLMSAGVPISEKTINKYIDNQENSQREKNTLNVADL